MKLIVIEAGVCIGEEEYKNVVSIPGNVQIIFFFRFFEEKPCKSFFAVLLLFLSEGIQNGA